MASRGKSTPGSQVNTAVHLERTDPDGSKHTSNHSNKVTEIVSDSWFVGEDIPNYHKRLRKGELLPHTNFQQYSAESRIGPGVRRWTDDMGRKFLWTPVPHKTILPPTAEECQAYMTDDHMYYVQAAASSIYTSGHDTLTAIAEFAQLRRMFSGLLTKFQKQLYRDPSKSLRQLYNNWLEGRYGWRILYFEIMQVAKIVEEWESFERTRHSQKSGATHKSYHLLSQNISSSSGIRNNIVISDDVAVSVRGSVVADLDLSVARFNAVLTAYEIIPFSFVLDWFVNVGQALETASFHVFSTAHTASYGYNVKVTRSLRSLFLDHESYVSDVESHWESTATANYTIRVPTSVSIKPQSKINLNDFKVLDLLALVFQLISKRRK